MMNKQAISLTTRELHSACSEQERGVLVRRLPSPLAEEAYPGSPFGRVGQPMRVLERLWVSECGQYYAQDARQSSGFWGYDVITVDGQTRWFYGRYAPTGWEDTDPRYLYPEFGRMVIYWGNRGYSRNGRYIPAFESGFAEYDTTVRAHSGKIARIGESHSATFLRQLPANQMAAWAHRLTLELTDIHIERLGTVLRAQGKAWGHLFYTVKEHYGANFMDGDPLVWVLSYRRISLSDHAEGQSPHMKREDAHV